MKWINKKREEVNIDSMSTEYLYNTVKMIWNNVIMPNKPFGEVISWSFKPPHTKVYLIDFFNAGMEALEDRADNEITKEFLAHVDDTLGAILFNISKELEHDGFDICEFGDKD